MSPENREADSAPRSLTQPAESATPSPYALGDGERMGVLRGVGEAKWTRRPLSDRERHHLSVLGAEVMRLRRRAGLSRVELGEAARLGESSIARIERGTRRTTRIRLERIAEAVTYSEDEARRVTARLVEYAGPALAETSPKAERAERRKERRQRRQRQIREEAAVLAEQLWRERKARADQWNR